MANKVLTRVWEHSRQRGAARCLIVALADVADEHGIAYPGIPYLANMICEDEDYTYKLLRKLIDAGELLHKPGGGRGRKTLYAVVIGLSDAQKAKLNTVLQSRVYYEKSGKNPVLQSRVSRNTAPQSRVSEGKNPALFEEKPCTSYDSSQSGSEPSGSDEPRPAVSVIHDHDPGDHDSPPPTPSKNEPAGGGGDGDDQKPPKTELYHWLRANGVNSAKAAERNQHHDLAATQAFFRRMVGDLKGAERKQRIGSFILALDADGPPPLVNAQLANGYSPPVQLDVDAPTRSESGRKAREYAARRGLFTHLEDTDGSA